MGNVLYAMYIPKDVCVPNIAPQTSAEIISGPTVVKVKCQYLINPFCLTGTLGGKHVCTSQVWWYLLRLGCRETEIATDLCSSY